MAKDIQALAAKLGARVVGTVPDTGGGVFGAARLVRAVAEYHRAGHSSRPRPPKRT